MPINRLVVEGYKSLKENREIGLRGLTILSGANSSGKSSIIQPLLLLKQTLEAGYDPGPLLISGPNVVFSETDQMLWSAAGEPRSGFFRLGMGASRDKRRVDVEVVLKPQKRGPTPLTIEECVWTIGKRQVSLRENLDPSKIESVAAIVDEFEKGLVPVLTDLDMEVEFQDDEAPKLKLRVERERTFLVVRLETPIIGMVVLPDPVHRGIIDNPIRRIIHVPALRGNPRRTYPVTAVEREFPGLFQDYTASVIARWQKYDKAKLSQLGKDLRQLSLTWKVRAEQKSDTEVEILVGRLAASRRGGSRDLVSIADVGFGFSQSLPVVVALLVASPEHLVYLEQPEIHLHPRAQMALASLIQRAVARGVQVVVETHSELLLLGIQQMVATGMIPTDKALLHWFTRDDCGITNITSAEFDEQGALGDVPIDFAEVGMMAMREYLEAASGR